nr:MAG TPA: hypothetical protein [Caudoviricetes sp.]
MKWYVTIFYRCTTFLFFFSKIRLEANTLFIIIN